MSATDLQSLHCYNLCLLLTVSIDKIIRNWKVITTSQFPL